MYILDINNNDKGQLYNQKSPLSNGLVLIFYSRYFLKVDPFKLNIFIWKDVLIPIFTKTCSFWYRHCITLNLNKIQMLRDTLTSSTLF